MVPHDQAVAARAVVGRIKPFAGEAGLVRIRVGAVAVRLLITRRVVLRKAVAVDAQCRLRVARVEAAVAETDRPVIAADLRHDVRVACNVMQAIARIVRAAHELDGADVQQRHQVEVGHHAVVAVARDPVDEQFDGVDLAFAREAADRDLAGRRALAVLRQHDAGELAEQLPVVADRLVGDPALVQEVDGRQDIARG
ncbi:conserved hypothetical protein [Ricinus communis]|uniref:Uncharacterized protein n=1 Tax=Ricinus communis TaxID=3988 RepID=B9TGS4_RICCO|nr:conserved hypothetical protein [Ricinus communis]